MNFFNRFYSLFTKSSQARIALSMNQIGQPQSSPKNFESFVRQGYQKNVLVYRCISLIAKTCSAIEWELYSKARSQEIEIEEHPLLTLIKRPNPMQGQSQFFEAVVAYLCLTGNSFIESVRPNEKFPPLELWSDRPDKMKIVPDSNGYPMRYEFTANSVTKKWEVNPVTFQSGILHLKTFNPTNDWFGMSPLESAMLSLDQNNSSNIWNLALLQNMATPSGILKVETTDSNPSGALSDEAYEKLKESFYESYIGSRNAGKPMILEGGIDWKSISLSPQDMNFINSKNVTAIEICQAFGVPPELVGLGQKTFNNYKEARLSFYEETVLPIMDFIKTELNNWLVPMFGERLELKYDKDDIEALTEKREQKYNSLQNVNWLTINEKREAIGYEPIYGWDVFIIGNQAVSSPAELNQSQNYFNNGSNTSENSQDQTTQTTEPEANDTSEVEDEKDLFSIQDLRGMEIKQINLINQKEKQSAFRKLNGKRNSYINSFALDLKEDLLEMSSKLKNAGSGKPPKLAEYAMLKELDEYMPIIKKTLERHITYVVNDFGGDFFKQYKKYDNNIELKKEKNWDYWAKNYIKNRSGKAVTEIQGTTTKKVQQVVKKLTEEALIDGNSDYDFAKDLESHFDSLAKSRAKLIARTETGMASNQATLEAAKSLEIPGLKKEWVSVQDHRTRDGEPEGEANHLEMNGVRVPLDEKFYVPPDAMMDGPGDESGGAGQVCNCRCVLVFNRGE